MSDKPDELWSVHTRLALAELNADFVYLLDHNKPEELAALFTEDALYTHGERRSVGRAAILELFNRRSAAGVRTVRHLQTGLRLQLKGPGQAFGQSVCTTFAADAAPPIRPAHPHLVADFDDEYRNVNGRWLIAVRHIHRIFLADDNTGPVAMIATKGANSS